MSDLNALLNAKLDSMGAPPSNNKTSVKLPEEETPNVAEETQPHDNGEDGPVDQLLEENSDSDGEPDENVDLEAEGGDENLEEREIRTLTEFAKATGWDPKDVYSLKIRLSETGDEISLGEVKDKLQNYQSRDNEVQEARNALHAEAQQLKLAQQQFLTGRQAMTEEVVKAQQDMAGIQAKFDAIPWDKLKEDDLGRYAALRQDLAAEYQAAQGRLEEAANKQRYQMQQLMARNIVEQDQTLLKLVPEWSDQKTYQDEMSKVQSYLVEMGFDPRELQTIYHGPARAVARDAWKWREHCKAVAASKNTMRKAPNQVLKPGGGTRKAPLADRELAALESKARETGRQPDKMKAARAIVRNSMRKR